MKVFAAVNRSWMPLSGGVDDAATLPGLSRKWLCADCFRAIIVLPLGCKFCSTGPYFIHVADPQWQVWVMQEPVDAVSALMASGATDNKALKTETKLRGRVELLELVRGSDWDTTQKGVSLPQGGATIVAFNNGGTSANFVQLHLPAQALEFFADIGRRAGLLAVFLCWAGACSGAEYTDKTTGAKQLNPFFDQICDDIELRRSVAPLVAAIKRKEAHRRQLEVVPLTVKEKQVLGIYEDKLLGKKERFEVLERIAGRVRGMEPGPQRSFIRQLGNVRTTKVMLGMLVQLSHDRDKNGFATLTTQEVRVLSESGDEAVSLLYLLCVAEDEEKESK